MISQEVRNFIELRKNIADLLYETFGYIIDHELDRGNINYNHITDSIIDLMIKFEDKNNKTEIE